jgi:hypothetical protein
MLGVQELPGHPRRDLSNLATGRPRDRLLGHGTLPGRRLLPRAGPHGAAYGVPRPRLRAPDRRSLGRHPPTHQDRPLARCPGSGSLPSPPR